MAKIKRDQPETVFVPSLGKSITISEYEELLKNKKSTKSQKPTIEVLDVKENDDVKANTELNSIRS